MLRIVQAVDDYAMAVLRSSHAADPGHERPPASPL